MIARPASTVRAYPRRARASMRELFPEPGPPVMMKNRFVSCTTFSDSQVPQFCLSEDTCQTKPLRRQRYWLYLSLHMLLSGHFVTRFLPPGKERGVQFKYTHARRLSI